jgi:hypothetical protein
MILWMEVSTDEYELPLAVATSPRELEKLRGLGKHTVVSAYNKYLKRKKTNKNKEPFCRFRRVEVDDEINEV